MEHGSIMEPSFPVIAVHKGWLGTPKGRGAESRTSVPDDPGSKTKQNETGARPARRQFEFVNSSTGKREKNPNVTRLIKSQARKNPVLDKRRKIDSTAGELGLASNWVDAQVSLETVSREKSDLEAYALNLSDVFTAWQFSGSSTAWCTWEYPIDMRPRTHRLLEMYLIYVTSRMYPEHLLLRTNPLISSTWFRYAVTDAAMLHAMLYSGGLYLALLEGRTETNDTIYHLNKTISIVNNRLKSSPHSVQDATIGAITCLALGGAIAGNQSIWHIHMQGLKQIIEKKGSLASFGGMLQTKIQRSDITGAIDYGAVPYLRLERSHYRSIWSDLPDQRLEAIGADVTRILTNCEIHPDLIAIIIALACFAQAIRSATLSNPKLELDPEVCSEDMYWIEYRLLVFPSALPQAGRERDIDRACRLGALIYIKATLAEFPHSKTGSSFLVEELQEALQVLPFMQAHVPLLMWLSLIGAAVSKSADRRKWFVGHLRKLVVCSRITSCREEDLDMTRVLGVRLVLGNAVDKVWESVMGWQNPNIR